MVRQRLLSQLSLRLRMQTAEENETHAERPPEGSPVAETEVGLPKEA